MKAIFVLDSEGFIDISKGFMAEDNYVPKEGEVDIPPIGGFYKPRWNGTQWVEGAPPMPTNYDPTTHRARYDYLTNTWIIEPIPMDSLPTSQQLSILFSRVNAQETQILDSYEAQANMYEKLQEQDAKTMAAVASAYELAVGIQDVPTDPIVKVYAMLIVGERRTLSSVPPAIRDAVEIEVGILSTT